MNPQDSVKDNNAWQQQTIEKLALSGLKEQKTARRWSIFFKLITFAYLGLLLIMVFGWFGGKNSAAPHTALIDVNEIGRAHV